MVLPPEGPDPAHLRADPGRQAPLLHQPWSCPSSYICCNETRMSPSLLQAIQSPPSFLRGFPFEARSPVYTAVLDGKPHPAPNLMDFQVASHLPSLLTKTEAPLCVSHTWALMNPHHLSNAVTNVDTASLATSLRIQLHKWVALLPSGPTSASRSRHAAQSRSLSQNHSQVQQTPSVGWPRGLRHDLAQMYKLCRTELLLPGSQQV